MFKKRLENCFNENNIKEFFCNNPAFNSNKTIKKLF